MCVAYGEGPWAPKSEAFAHVVGGSVLTSGRDVGGQKRHVLRMGRDVGGQK